MRTLYAVLKFIDVKNISVPEFEMLANLTPGIINRTFEQNNELSNDVVNKIINRFEAELRETGFFISSLEHWPGRHNDYAIIERDLNDFFFGNEEIK